MALISEGTFQQLRNLSEGAMPDTFAVEVRGAWVDDGSGGGYYGPGSVQTYPCRKTASGADPETERIIAGLNQPAGAAALVLPLGSPVGLDDVGTYTNARTGGTMRYAVKAVRTTSYSPHLHLVVTPAATQGG